jgi:hypothetical protein
MPFWLVRISMEIDFITHCHVVIYFNLIKLQTYEIDDVIRKKRQIITVNLLSKHHHHHQGFLNDTNIGTNDLLNVSKKFECFKKGHFYWKLNRRYSLSYKNSSLYRNRLSLLINSRNQLSLDLSEFLGLHDVSAHADVRDIDLSRCLFI